MPRLLGRSLLGELQTEVIITHHLPFEEAARGQEALDEVRKECRKFLLTPGRPSAAELMMSP